LYFYIKYWLLPPGIIILLLLFGLLVWRCRLFSWILVVGATVLLGVISLPVIAQEIINPLQRTPVLTQVSEEPHSAIVILAGGRRVNALEFGGGEELSCDTLVRVQYGAYLAKKTHLPVLVSGGSAYGEALPEARIMQKVMQRDFGVQTKWLESESRNTRENATKTLAMLKKRGIKKIYLVTQAMHMQRALLAFQNTDIQVVPAPTGFVSVRRVDRRELDWTPSFSSAEVGSYAMYEYMGLLWYRLRASIFSFKNSDCQRTQSVCFKRQAI